MPTGVCGKNSLIRATEIEAIRSVPGTSLKETPTQTRSISQHILVADASHCVYHLLLFFHSLHTKRNASTQTKTKKFLNTLNQVWRFPIYPQLTPQANRPEKTSPTTSPPPASFKTTQQKLGDTLTNPKHHFNTRIH